MNADVNVYFAKNALYEQTIVIRGLIFNGLFIMGRILISGRSLFTIFFAFLFF